MKADEIMASLGRIEKGIDRIIKDRNELLRTLRTVVHTLRSYEHGNSSPDLAIETAEHVEHVIAIVTEGH